MPFKSKSQMRKFGQLLNEGKITKTTFDEWAGASKGKKLPEKVKPKSSKPKSLLRRRHTPI